MKEINVQELVLGIIQLGHEKGLPYMSKKLIMEEARNSPLGEQDIPNYSGKKSKLQCQIDQALYQLHKNKKIKKKGNGWAAVKVQLKTVPICRHLIQKNNQPYCPLYKTYIGSPRYHCSVVFTSRHGPGGWTKEAVPKCPGYTSRKPTPMVVRNSLEKIKKAEEIAELERRRYSMNIHDPLSRKFMPKLYEREKRK